MTPPEPESWKPMLAERHPWQHREALRKHGRTWGRLVSMLESTGLRLVLLQHLGRRPTHILAERRSWRGTAWRYVDGAWLPCIIRSYETMSECVRNGFDMTWDSPVTCDVTARESL